MKPPINLIEDIAFHALKFHLAKMIDDISRNKRILVIGDSHAAVFSHGLFREINCLARFYICSVGGATISGLSNPNSQTQARPLFEYWSKKTKPDITIFLLGEVDTGFLLWHRHENYGDSVDTLLETTIEKYTNLIERLGNNNSIVISTPLPTIKDGEVLGDVANARKTIKADQKARTELTLHFNQEIKSWASSKAIQYIDLDHLSLGKNQLVLPSLLNSDPMDHHYSKESYARLMYPKLSELLT